MNIWTAIVYTVLSLLIFGGAFSVKKRLEAAGFYYPAPIGAFGVILLARSIITKLDPHPGFLLVRRYTAGELVFLWLVLILLVAAILVLQFRYDRMPAVLQGSATMEAFRWLGWTFFVWALLVPLTWISPLGRAVLIIVSLVIAVYLLIRAAKSLSLLVGAVGLLALIIFLFSFLGTPSSFWKQDVPRDFGEKVCQVTPGTDHCKREARLHSSGKGDQVHPTVILYSTVIKDGRASVTATCATTQTCTDKVHQHEVYDQTLANQFNVTSTLVMEVDGKKVGSPIVKKPLHVQSDAQFGAVSNDPCSLSSGKLGVELPDPATGKLACRTLVGHSGPNF